MTTQPEAPETTPEDRSVLSRRTVLRAGAHAAWAIPAVQVITQAPALAASGSITSSSSTTGWTGSSAPASFPLTLSVTNPTSKDLSSWVITIDFAGSGLSKANVTVQTPGWTVAGNGTSRVTLTGATAVPQNTSAPTDLVSVIVTPGDASDSWKPVNASATVTSGTQTAVAAISVPSSLTSLRVSGTAVKWAGSTPTDATFGVNFTVTNDNLQPTSQLKVKLSFPSTWAPVATTLSDTTWTATATTPNSGGGASEWTFTAPSNGQLSKASRSLTVTFKTTNSSNAGQQVAVTPSAWNAGAKAATGADVVVPGVDVLAIGHTGTSKWTGNSNGLKVQVDATVKNTGGAAAPAGAVTVTFNWDAALGLKSSLATTTGPWAPPVDKAGVTTVTNNAPIPVDTVNATACSVVFKPTATNKPATTFTDTISTTSGLVGGSGSDVVNVS